jgi:DNA-binding HxlR family transcriptional regulator
MIGADYLVADGCQATASDETNVTAPDNGELHRRTPRTHALFLTSRLSSLAEDGDSRRTVN